MSASVASWGFMIAWAFVCSSTQNASGSPVLSPQAAPSTVAAARPPATTRDRRAATTSDSRRRPPAAAVTSRWLSDMSRVGHATGVARDRPRRGVLTDRPAQGERVQAELPPVLDERFVVGQLVVGDAGVPLLHRDEQ